MALRPCLGCRKLIAQGSRCAACERRRFPNSPGRLRGRRWQEVRARVLAASGYRCAECGAEDVPLEVHHRDHNHLNNAPGNLAPLCKPCHARAVLKPSSKQTRASGVER